MAQSPDNQEGDKEDGGGAEVAHIGQTGQAHAGEQDEQAQVPLAEEPVQGGRPGKDVADFGQLRGLHRDAGNGQPVGRSIFGAGEAQQVEHHGEAQQADGPGGHEPADFLGPVQVAQEDPQHQEQGQSQHHAEELLEQGGGIGGGGHRQGEGGQEEGDGLHLKAYPAQGAEGEEVQPHHPRQQQEGERDHHRGVLPLADGELECGEGLEHGEEHQPQPGGHGPFPPERGGAARSPPRRCPPRRRTGRGRSPPPACRLPSRPPWSPGRRPSRCRPPGESGRRAAGIPQDS